MLNEFKKQLHMLNGGDREKVVINDKYRYATEITKEFSILPLLLALVHDCKEIG